MTSKLSSFTSARPWRLVIAPALLLVLASTARAETPAVRLSTAPLVTPENALAYYNSFPNPTQHTEGETPWRSTPSELTALAQGLGSAQARSGAINANMYAERVAEYVRSNIDVEFRYGLGKGARGAVIDQSGTPFDQAHLMMELLKVANVTATYKVGTITLNAQQFGQWTGLVTGLVEATPPALPTFTVNAVAACQFLADGGIPARINNATSCGAVSGNLTTVTLGHIWIEVGGKLYDPAFKRYNLRAGIDLPQSMGCGTSAAPTCGSLATTSATTGATSGLLDNLPGVDMLKNIQETALNTRLQGFATSLQTAVLGSRADAELEDVIGGRLPDAMYSPGTPGTSLPYPSSVQLTWSGKIPNQYRTRVRFHYRVIDPVLYADELAGRRTFFFSVTPLTSSQEDNPLTLSIDEFAFVCPRVEPFVPVPREFETAVNHPYAANNGTYADATRNWAFGGRQLVGNQVLIFSLGNTGAGLPKHFADYQNTLEAPPAGTIEPFTGLPVVTPDAANFISAARLLYQESLGVRLIEGVSKTRVTQHHAIGMTYDNSGPIPGTFVKPGASGGTAFFSLETKLSVASRSNDATARTAAFSTLATVGAAIEGSVMQQALDSWIPVTTGSVFSLANRKSIAFINVNAGTIGAVLPKLSNHNNANLQTATTEGYELILPQNGDPGGFSVTGGLYLTVATPVLTHRTDSIAYLIGADIKGGGGQPGAEPALQAVQRTLAVEDSGLRQQAAFSVDLANGELSMTAPPDIVTGNGEFPFSLPFQRTYVSSNSYAELRFPSNAESINKYYGSDLNSFARLGGGWTHNYQISASISNDGNLGMGANRGADALAAIAGVYSIYDLARTSSFPRRVTAPFVGNWMTNQFLNNTVSVARQLDVSTFVRLPGGTFLPPRGSDELLTQSGTRQGPLCAADCSQAVNVLKPIYEPGTAYNYVNVTLAYTLGDGSVISFIPSDYTKLFRITNQIALPNFIPDTWVFKNGVSVRFNSTLTFDDRFVTTKRVVNSISNNLGRSLSFSGKGIVPLIPFQTDPPFGGQPAILLNEVRDETGRTVKFERQCLEIRGFVAPGEPFFGYGPFGCNTFEVVTPDNARTVYAYDITAQSPQSAIFPRPAYRLRRWFTPDDLTTPFLTIDYDELYRVRKTLDKNLVATEYQMTGLFDEKQKRGQIRDPLGALTTLYFDQDNRLLGSIDPLNRMTFNTYDAAGRLASTRFPEGDKILFTYDARSNVTSTTRKAKPDSGLADIVTRATYPASCANPATCNQPTSITDARGQVTTYTYHTNGQLLTISNPSVPLGTSTGSPVLTLCYASFPAIIGTGSLSLPVGRIERVDATTNRVTTYTYDRNSKLSLATATQDPAASLAPTATSSPTCSPVTKSGALNLASKLTFDAVGNVTTIDGPRTDVTDLTTYSFDAMRRLTRIDAPLGAIRRFDYLPDGSLFKLHQAQVENPVDSNPAHWRTEVRAYHPTGEVSSITDPQGNVVRFEYDANGRQVLVTDPDGTRGGIVYDLAGQISCTWLGLQSPTPPTSCSWDPASYVSAGNNGAIRYAAYAYSLNGEAISVQDANNNITGYVFDGFDRPMFKLFPDAGNGSRCSVTGPITADTLPTCVPGQTYELTKFDANSNLLSLRTRRAETITWTYDNLDRVRTKAAANLPMITYDYNLAGEPLALTSPAGDGVAAHSIKYDYDAAGRAMYEENLLGGVPVRVSFDYDQAGNRRTTRWQDGYAVNYQYDALSRMSAAWEGAVGAIKLADYTYDVVSRRKEVRLAGQATNKVTYSYESDNDLDLMTNVLNTVNVTFDYDYTGSGRIRTISTNDGFHLPAPSTAKLTTYVPDKLNRYASVDAQELSYDGSGNLLTAFPASGKQTYTYDSENRLRSVAVNGGSTPTIFYDYDPLGRRIEKRVNGVSTYYVLDGAEEIAELAADRSVLRRYVTGQAVDDRIAMVEGGALSNPPKTYYHTNHQLSVIAMTDAAGNASGCAAGLNCQRLAYEEYGQLGSGVTATGQPFRYTGRRFDEETGLYYYRARYYSPQLGRFLQTDPIGYGDDLNLYTYAANDPVNITDPSGQIVMLLPVIAASLAFSVAVEFALQTLEIKVGIRTGYDRNGFAASLLFAFPGFLASKGIASIPRIARLGDAGTKALKFGLDVLADTGISILSGDFRNEELTAGGLAFDVGASQLAGKGGELLGGFLSKRAKVVKSADALIDRLKSKKRNPNSKRKKSSKRKGRGRAEKLDKDIADVASTREDFIANVKAVFDLAAGNAGSRVIKSFLFDPKKGEGAD